MPVYSVDCPTCGFISNHWTANESETHDRHEASPNHRIQTSLAEMGAAFVGPSKGASQGPSKVTKTDINPMKEDYPALKKKNA